MVSGVENHVKVLLLLKRDACFLVHGGEGEGVHVADGPLEGEAGQAAGKGEGGLV